MASIMSSDTLKSGKESVTSAIKEAQGTWFGRFMSAWTRLRASEGAILIAWQMLFSIFPMVIGVLAILGLVLRDPERQAAIAEAIANQFPEQASDLVGIIVETRDLGGIYGVVSIILLLWSGSALFGAMATVVDRFYGVPDRSFLKQRLVSFAMMAVYTVLIVVSVASASVTGLLVGISEEILPFEVSYLGFAVGWLVSLTSAILMFLVLYRFVPNARLRVWHVWKGAVLAGVLFVLLSQIFPIYLRFLGSGFAAYKALGVFLLLMTWFYFVAQILCAGALLNAVLSGHCRPHAPSEPSVARAKGRRDVALEPAEEVSSGPIKVLVWAGLTATVTSLMLLLARRAASSLWRTLTRQDPPS